MNKILVALLVIVCVLFFSWPIAGMIGGADAAAWVVAIAMAAFGLFAALGAIHLYNA